MSCEPPLNLTARFFEGGGSGVGRTVCELFAGQGAQVVVADICKASAEATLKYLISETAHLAVQVDVTKEDSVSAAFEAARKHLGKAPEIIVNSAGVSGPNKTLSEISKKEIEDVFSVNFFVSTKPTNEGTVNMQYGIFYLL